MSDALWRRASARPAQPHIFGDRQDRVTPQDRLASGPGLLPTVPIGRRRLAFVGALVTTALVATMVPGGASVANAQTEQAQAELAQLESDLTASPTDPGIDTEYLSTKLATDDQLAASRGAAAALAGEQREVATQISLMEADVDVLAERIQQLSFAMGNQELIISEARESQRDMAGARTDIILETQVIDAEVSAMQVLLAERAIAAYKVPSRDARFEILGADDVLSVPTRTVLIEAVAQSDSAIITKLEERRMALATNERVIEALAHQVARVHDEETQARDVLEANRAEYELLQVALDMAIAESRGIVQGIASEREVVDRDIAEREAQLREIAELRAERRARCLASGGTVTDNGDEAIDCTFIGATLAPGVMLRPLPGAVSSGFGMRKHPIDGVQRMHRGWDFDGAHGAAIGAAAAGEVYFVGWISGFGNTTLIDHGGGVETLYAHQSTFAVAEGDVVAAGQTVGYVGSTGKSTGPHLHFEVHVGGEAVDPAQFVAN